MKPATTLRVAAVAMLLMSFGHVVMADESWDDTSTDPGDDVITLEPFVVDANDPATYDYAGEFAYEMQQEWLQELQSAINESLQNALAAADEAFNNMMNELNSNLQAATQKYLDKARDAADGYMNTKNNWGLTSPDNLKNNLGKDVAGYVISDGEGGFIVVIDVDQIRKAVPEITERALEIAIESARQHELTHETEAAAANPDVFDTPFPGWGLGSTPSTADEHEVDAYNAQLDYLYDKLNNDPSLTADDKNSLEKFIDKVTDELHAHGG